MKDSRDKFGQWKEAFEEEGMTVNLDKTKVMVGGLEEDVAASKNNPCSVCGRRVKVNTVFRTNCARWVHRGCTMYIHEKVPIA